MPWDGLGTYNPPGATFPEVNGTVIDADRYNPTILDLAAGITASLHKGGQNAATANLPMGGFKHTGAADGAAAGQYLVFGQTSASLGSLALTGALTFNDAGADVDARFEGDTDVNLLFLDASTDRVGIGTATPSVKLDVVGAAAVSTSLSVGTTLTANQNVTFNAPTSGATLTAKGSASVGEVLKLETSVARGSGGIYAQFHDATGVKGYVGYGGGDDTFYITNSLNTALKLYTNNTDRVTVGAAGNVTINAPSSGVAATVVPVGAAAAMRFPLDAAFLEFYNTANTTRSGYVQLHATAASRLWVEANQALEIGTNNTTRVTVAAAGNVTINSPSSGTALSVGSTGQVALFGSASAANAYVALQYNSTNLGYVGNGSAVASGAGATDFAIGSTGARALYFGTNDTARAHITSGGVFNYGSDEIGYRKIPRSTTTTTAALTDRGRCIAVAASIAIPDATFAAGDSFSIYNDSAGAVSITAGGALTLRLAGTTTTGTRTLAARGLATLWFNGASEALCTGAGVS